MTVKEAHKEMVQAKRMYDIAEKQPYSQENYFKMKAACKRWARASDQYQTISLWAAHHPLVPIQ